MINSFTVKAEIIEKVSVIVPIYNSEQYLSKCLVSVISQTHSDLEIILVNDGSIDASRKIIDELASTDKRIVVIHKENNGIGSAYKAAFEVMIGDYVLFVDSDDWLELNAVEELLKLAISNEADMVAFGLSESNPKGEMITHPSLKSIDLINSTNAAILKTHFEVLKHPTLVRLYKRALFNDIEVFLQNIGIDEMLTPQLLVKCNRAVYTSRVYYNVLIRQDSVCRAEYNEKKIGETLRVYRFVCSFTEEYLPAYSTYFKIKYLGILIAMYQFSLKTDEGMLKNSIIEIQNDIGKYFEKAKQTRLFNQESFRLKFNLYLISNYSYLYKIVYSTLKGLNKIKFPKIVLVIVF